MIAIKMGTKLRNATRSFIICASLSNDSDKTTENKAGGAGSKYEGMGNLYNIIVGGTGKAEITLTS